MNNQQFKFQALTCIDPASALLEIVRIDDATARTVATQFENSWLARYPKPVFIVHDNGSEFLGAPFALLLQSHGIQPKRISTYTPTANAYIERVHQTLGNVLRIQLHVNPPTADKVAIFLDNVCATTMYATRISAHRALDGLSPGAAIFQRDMLHATPVIADWLAIRQGRQELIDRTNETANSKRRFFDYQIGQQVLLVPPGILQKSRLRFDGPFPITQVHTNGTVTIQRDAVTTDRVNIRRIKPFHQ